MFRLGLATQIKNILLVISGTFVLAFGVGLFIIPFDLVTGGVSGLGIIAEKTLGNIDWLSEIRSAVYASSFNAILFVIGFLVLGKSFAMKTLISALFYPIALSIAVSLSTSDFGGGFFNLHSEMYLAYGELPVIIATVFGGAMIGAGCAITYLGGGSTGGVDVIVFVLVKCFKSLKRSIAMFICDSVIILSGMFAVGNLVISLLGILSAFIAAITIDKLFIGDSFAFTAYVISDKCDLINRSIIERLDRTTTILPCKGGYSGIDKQVLMSTFSVSQYAEFTALIASIDKKAFVTVHRAHEINGEGWSFNPSHEIYEKGENDDNSQT